MDAIVYIGEDRINIIDVKFRVGSYSDLLWELYQESGKFEDMTRWLKHRAYENWVKESLKG